MVSSVSVTLLAVAMAVASSGTAFMCIVLVGEAALFFLGLAGLGEPPWARCDEGER